MSFLRGLAHNSMGLDPASIYIMARAWCWIVQIVLIVLSRESPGVGGSGGSWLGRG